LQGRTLKFKQNWASQLKWFHFKADVKGVLCFKCCKANCSSMKSSENAKEKMSCHQQSLMHNISLKIPDDLNK
jgi:hypothetical protein